MLQSPRKLFRKHLMLFFMTILIPAVLFLAFNLYRSSNQLVQTIEEHSANQLNQMNRSLDSLIANVDQLAIQLSLTPSIYDLLKEPYRLSIYDYSVIKEQLRGWTTSNSIISSLALHIYQNEKVLTTNEGIYDSAHYFDSDFIAGLRKEATEKHVSWTGIRTVKGSGGMPDAEMLSFARSIPATSQLPLGMLIIDIQKGSFMKAVLNSPAAGETADTIIVLDPQNKLVSGAQTGLNAEQLALHLDNGEMKTEVISLPDARYFVTAYKVQPYGWTLLQLTPYTMYSKQMQADIGQAFMILLAILLAGLGVSYLFASILFDPWRRLAERLREYVARPSGTIKADAYNIVDHAIGHLITTVDQNKPIIREHMVQELLRHRQPKDNAIIEQFARMGICFEHPNFLVLLIVVEAGVQDQGNDVYLYSLAEELLAARFSVAGSILDRSMFGFIVNFSSDQLEAAEQERLEQCFGQIKHEAYNRWAVSLHAVAGGIRPLWQVYEAYELARRAVTYRAFWASSNSQIVYADGEREELEFDYPASYQKLLLNIILAGDRQAAEKLVSQLFEKYIHQNHYSQPKLQQMIVMLMSHMLSSLVEEGYDIGKLMGEVNLLNLEKYKDSAELQAYIHSAIYSMMDYIHEIRSETSTPPYIQEAIMYMEKNYDRNIAMSDVAEAVGISSGHLGRLFKAETGKPPLEYLTQYRLQEGKKLLLDTSKSLQTISEAIGYNDVHTFIRFFKKYEGITPGEYRKKVM